MSSEIVKIDQIRASEINRTALANFLYQLLANIFLVAGYKSDEKQMQFLLEEVAKDIQTRFRLLELPEIKKAFDDGVRCLYGDYYGINTVTINKWLKSYVDSGEHNKYLENKVKTLAPLLEEKTRLSEAEIDDIIRAGIITCFINYQITGVVLDYGSPKIDWLLKKGIIKPTPEERSDYKEQARQELEQNARDKKESINRMDRNEAKKEMEELLTMLDSDTKIQSLAKNMCLRDWFERVLDSGDDIRGLIK